MIVSSGATRKIALAKAFRQAYRSTRGHDARARRRSEEYLAQTLGKLKGVPQKLGQLLSLRAAAHEEQPLASLSYSGHDPMPWDQIQAILREELDSAESEFEAIDTDPLAAASLSQVHAARARDGRAVVVKVQYPEIWKAIWGDLEILGWIGLPFKGFQKRFRLDEYRKLILQTLCRELDYESELESLRAFRVHAARLGFVDVPEPLPSLCTSHVLTMTRLEGETLAEVCRSWPLERRALLAQRIVELFMDGLTGAGLLHADPHPGNYRFVDTPSGPRVVLYDFGCVQKLSDEFRLGLRRIISTLRQQQDGDWLAMLESMGFDPVQLRPLSHRIRPVLEALFAPFVCPAPFDVTKWHPSQDVERLLGADRWALRTAAPASFLFVMRGFHGILYYLRELAAPVDLRWQERLGEAEPGDVASSSEIDPGGGARQLCVTVEENGEWKVRLFLPTECARRLSEEMPDDVLARLDRLNFDLAAVERRYQSLEILPRETIFELRDGPKSIRVWLE